MEVLEKGLVVVVLCLVRFGEGVVGWDVCGEFDVWRPIEFCSFGLFEFEVVVFDQH